MTDSTDQTLRRPHFFLRHPQNPVLPLGREGSFDATSNMNPCVIRRDDEYWLFYAGGCPDGKRRICIAKTKVAGDLTQWEKVGPILQPGPPGSFDARWTVLPHVVEITPGQWHLYYTANCGVGKGLAAFPGIGLATSDDLIHWTKYSDKPVLAPSHVEGEPDAIGIAGGSVIHVKLENGSDEWRFYYTGCPTLGDDVFLDQQKTCCLAVSKDGIQWNKRGVVMRRNPDRDYEDIAVAGPVVRQVADGSFRMWYSAIGTRWGFYSICYAESDDGLTWRRGEGYGDNLVLGPTGQGWERQMVEYPAIIFEGERTRLFYSANGYGSSGCGTALSSPLRAQPRAGEPFALDIASESAALPRSVRIANTISTDEGRAATSPTHWHSPDGLGRIWAETVLLIDGRTLPLRVRALVNHASSGLNVRLTLVNEGNRTLHQVVVHPHIEKLDGVDPVEITWEGAFGDISAGHTRTLTGQITNSPSDAGTS